MKIKKITALLLITAVASSTILGGCSGKETQGDVPVDTEQEVTEDFESKMETQYKEVEMKYRPYARWWLAEGSHTDTTLKEAIQDLYDTGYGGLEIVTLDESAYMDDASYAWGSPEWIHDTQLIVSECQKLGMSVSMTSGTHFASANLTVITPDDPEASQELGYTHKELKGKKGEKTSYSGVLEKCVLPEDVKKQKLVSVVTAKVKSWGNDETETVLDMDHMEVITDQVEEQEDGGYTIHYTAEDDGDYILFAFYQYGTGEYYLPAATGKSYTVNYLSKDGMNALIDYWNENVLTKELQETIDQIEECTIYMDSLELVTRGDNSAKQLWCDSMLQQFEDSRGYDAEKYLPLMIKTLGEGVGAFGQEITYAYAGSDKTFAKNLKDDFFQTQTEMYRDNMSVLSDWLHSKNMKLRAEPSYGKTFEVSEAVKPLDYVETESFEFNNELDLYRTLSGAAHLYNMRYSSETGAALGNNYVENNAYYRNIFYLQYAAGIQKMVTHGYSTGYGPEGHTKWPGYEGMKDVFSERFDKRQPGYVDYLDINTHLSRIQKVLEQGVPQMDIAMLRTDYYVNNGMWTASNELLQNKTHQNEGYYWQDTELQNAGYTYDYFSPYLLNDEDVNVENGKINAEGVAYQAAIVMQDEMPYRSAQVLLEAAKNGLPILFVNHVTELINKSDHPKQNTIAASTTGSNDGKDEELAALIKEIKALDNVKTVESEEDAYEALKELGVSPRIEHVKANAKVLPVMRKAEDETYLYLYNYMYGDQENYQGQVSVEGMYQPYILNTWTGEIEKTAYYAVEEGRTVLNVDLAPGDVSVFIMKPAEGTMDTIVSAENVYKILSEDGTDYFAVSQSGTVAVTLSNGDVIEQDVTAPEDIQLTGWSLAVDSYSPGKKITRTETTEETGVETTEVTYDTKHEILDAGILDELVAWSDMQNIGDTVSGIGTYKTTFMLPEDWDETNGAVFEAEDFNMGTAAVFVNDKKVAVNMDGKFAEISDFVKPGENTIEVRVTSSLRNIMRKVGYDQGWVNEMFGLTSVPEADDYGMTGETNVVTYKKVKAFEQ